MNRQKKILLVLGIIFTITIVYRIYHPFKQDEVATLTFTGKKTPLVAAESENTPDDKQQHSENVIRLDLLATPPACSGTVQKNIFFQAVSPKADPAKKKIVNKPKRRIAKAPPVPEPPHKSPAEQVKQELSNYKIFGIYRQGNKNGVFLEKGKQIIVIHEGDKIEGKYRIKKITDKQITLYAEQFNEIVHLDMSDF
jgi:Tfp pilus assembly protein PilP